MPRIRTIKPEFWGDEKLAPMDVLTRFVFLGLISMADDAGRLLDSVKQIDAMLFPLTDDTAREALANLSRAGRVVRGKTASGQPIIQIVNWRHQKVDHPNLAAALPPIAEGVTDDSRDIRENVASDSRDIRDSISTSTNYLLPTTPAAPVRTTTIQPASAEVLAVLAHYTARHPKRRPGPKERKIVARSLATYAVAELCEAIDGNADDPWCREKAKHELDYTLRDNGQIDTFRAKAERVAADRAKPIVLNGELTPYGERITRPDKVSA